MSSEKEGSPLPLLPTTRFPSLEATDSPLFLFLVEEVNINTSVHSKSAFMSTHNSDLSQARVKDQLCLHLTQVLSSIWCSLLVPLSFLPFPLWPFPPQSPLWAPPSPLDFYVVVHPSAQPLILSLCRHSLFSSSPVAPNLFCILTTTTFKKSQELEHQTPKC